MRVLIFLSDYQYDVVNEFAHKVGETLEQHGAEVIFIDFKDNPSNQEIANVFITPIDFVISFNGVGSNLKYKGQSFYDLVNTVFVMWLVDHPVHLIDRINVEMQNKIIVCVDDSHAEYIENNMDEKVIVTFIPHGVDVIPLDTNIKKKYNITFAGHISINEYEEKILSFEQAVPGLKELLLNKLQNQGNIHLGMLKKELYSKYPALIQYVNKNNISEHEILYYIDRYLRACKRNQVIETLLKEGYVIDFFGVIPEEHPFLKSPYFKHHGMVGFREMKSIFQQSKFVLNILPNFPNGGHERIFTSMMCGAIPLTDTNEYIENNLPYVSTFKIKAIHAILPEINMLLADETNYSQKVQLNYDLVVNSHTWQQRLEELLYVIQEARKYWNKQ